MIPHAMLMLRLVFCQCDTQSKSMCLENTVSVLLQLSILLDLGILF
jgi:hypothetical protein